MINIDELLTTANDFMIVAQDVGFDPFRAIAKKWEDSINKLKNRYYGIFGFSPAAGWESAGAGGKALDALFTVNEEDVLSDEAIGWAAMDLTRHFTKEKLQDNGFTDAQIEDFRKFLKSYQDKRMNRPSSV